jgi:formate C-acetyltransferase
MPTDLWTGQLLAGSMTLEKPRIHAEWGFPTYITDAERELGRQCGYDTGCFGHIVPDYPHLLAVGLRGIRAEADAQRPAAATPAETAFLDSAVVALDAVIAFGDRLADRCAEEACLAAKRGKYPRARELAAMADNVLFAPAGPARTFWQALQSVWLLHMVFHSTMDGNAMGRLDQYCWPLLEADLAAGRVDWPRAMELVSCFALKFNERARASDEQRPETRGEEALDAARLTRHATSSQLGRNRDRLDATNHWLQNIVVGGLRPDGSDGTNPLTFLLLEAYRRNEMTNPLLTVRLHAGTPPALLEATCEVLKCGGGMPALFNDEALVPAIERLGIPRADALDYTNDGCWETIVPGRTDFRFQRMSLMLPLEWALTGGRSRVVQGVEGIDTGDARRFATFDELWAAWCRQLDAMVASTVRRVVQRLDERSVLAPVPLLSALIDGSIASRRDLTAGGAKYRTYGFLAEGAAHAIDSLATVRTVIFEQHAATMAELCDALDADFAGCDSLRLRLEAAPKYGNDDDAADSLGRSVMVEFTAAVQRHAAAYEPLVKAACGAATFSWYIGIGEGLGASPDGRRAGEPVSSNLSPALGRDVQGLPGAILSYARMPHANMPAGAPLDLRVARRLVEGPAGTDRMAALLRTFVETGGSMLTLTVADTEELRAAQRDPDHHKSLRVRMGGWSAYFTMLSHQQQDHHIGRQEPRR